MTRLDETEITKAILNVYHENLLKRIVSDVVIVGAGPAGLVAGFYLARQGAKVTVLEKRLAPGGGIWGGGMGMNVAVVQQEAVPILDEMRIRYTPKSAGLFAVDSVELAAGLCLGALQAGVAIFNLVAVEDLCMHQGRVTGVVVNRTMISGALPVDPIVLTAQAVVDATGHETVLVAALRKRELLPVSADRKPLVEGPLDADSGERFVVEHVQEIFPGLWIAGMSVSATLGGPRMGPIFGGMLLSGQHLAQRIGSGLKA